MKKLLKNLSALLFCVVLGWAFVRFVAEVGGRAAERTRIVGDEIGTSKMIEVSRKTEPKSPESAKSENDAFNEEFRGKHSETGWLALHAWLTHGMEYHAAEATPCREALIRVGAWFSRLGEMSGDNTTGVVEGPNGWLFLQSRDYGHSMEDYQGLERFDVETTEEIRVVLEKIRDMVASFGGQFCFLIAPNKENVYPEQMPRGIRRFSDFSRTDCLVEYLKSHSDVCVVNPKLELRRWKKHFEVYYPLDTHWNDVGGYIGTLTFLEALGREGCPLENRQVELVEYQRPNDLPRIANFSEEIVQGTKCWTIQGYPDVSWNAFGTTDEWTEMKRHTNPNARTSDRLLIVGDSFMQGMDAALLEEFSEVWRVHWNRCENLVGILEEYHPDVVLWEIVERAAGGIVGVGHHLTKDFNPDHRTLSHLLE
jgi:hypothetical protein